MYRHLLVPLDDSGLAIELVSNAIEVAEKLSAKITFMHASADWGATSSGALQHALDPKGFAHEEAGPAQAVLAKAAVVAQAAGIEHQSVAMISSRPYEAIIETARDHKCDLIFMASHGRRGLGRLMSASQTQKVIEHSPIAVLIASVESRQGCRDMKKAVSIIRDEHRSLAAVIHGMQHLVRTALGGEAVRLDLLKASLFYIRHFPATLHHPKEEQWLFARLTGKDDELDGVIEILKQQHKQGESRLQELESSFHALEQEAGFLPEFSAVLEEFAEGEWEHMSVEERTVIPAAQERLSDKDWKAIATAFGENGDPRFQTDKGEAFRTLFTRIQNMAGLPQD